MYTIQTIKEMMNQSTTLQEFEEIKCILIDTRVQILESYDKMSEKTQSMLCDDEPSHETPPSMKQIKILEEYAKASKNHEKMYTSIQLLLNDVHMRIRGFYD